MPRHLSYSLCLLFLAAGCVGRQPVVSAPAMSPPLKIVSWNLEFLAEHDGDGCRPRNAAEYAHLREIVDGLDADIIAFEEVENPAAAARVFDPVRYRIVMENRQGERNAQCAGGRQGQMLIRQAVGFAVRRSIPFDRAADVAALQLGDPNLRSGVDITVHPPGGRPLRLLAVHLKSGCFSGVEAQACPVLLRQVPVVESWIDAAARGPDRFIVLGDWNRRLALPGDVVWREIDDADPPNAALRLADAGTTPHCDPRFDAFIDHIVFDPRTAADFRDFREVTFPAGDHPSDHCPVTVTIAR